MQDHTTDYLQTHHPKTNAICLTCGKGFKTKPNRIKKGKGKYCSTQCCYASKRRGETRVCLECSKEFYVLASALKRGEGKYCSHACFGKNYGRLPSKKIEIACEQCGKPSFKYPSRISAGVGRFCSMECQAIWQTALFDCTCRVCQTVFKTNKGTIVSRGGDYCSAKCAGRERKKLTACICLQCGKSFGVFPYEKRRGGGRFCSYSCNHIYQGRTAIEAILEECLKDIGIPYVAEYGIGRFNADFFVEPNFVFEADGDYWHALPVAVEKDKRRDELMQSLGYIVTRFSESTIRNHQEQVSFTIKQVLGIVS